MFMHNLFIETNQFDSNPQPLAPTQSTSTQHVISTTPIVNRNKYLKQFFHR